MLAIVEGEAPSTHLAYRPPNVVWYHACGHKMGTKKIEKSGNLDRATHVDRVTPETSSSAVPPPL